MDIYLFSKLKQNFKIIIENEINTELMLLPCGFPGNKSVQSRGQQNLEKTALIYQVKCILYTYGCPIRLKMSNQSSLYNHFIRSMIKNGFK